jgi:hypothetical protein
MPCSLVHFEIFLLCFSFCKIIENVVKKKKTTLSTRNQNCSAEISKRLLQSDVFAGVSIMFLFL